MAIISGQVPPAQEVPVHYKRRVVVKFRPEVRLSYSAAAVQELASSASREWNELTAAHPGIALVPYFSLGEGQLRDFARRASQTGQTTVPPSFTSYFAIECPAGVEPEAVARTVAAWSNVETAYVEAGPTPPRSILRPTLATPINTMRMPPPQASTLALRGHKLTAAASVLSTWSRDGP